jgi:uncharacterized protein (TIRG00374 family)
MPPSRKATEQKGMMQRILVSALQSCDDSAWTARYTSVLPKNISRTVYDAGDDSLKSLYNWFKAHQVWRNIGVLVVLGAGVYFLLPQFVTLQNSWSVLTSMEVWAVALAFLFQVLSYIGSGYMLQSILEIANERISLWLNTLIVLGSYSIGMVAGGLIGTSAVIYRWTRKSQGNIEGATLASVFLPQFNTLMLVLVSLFGLAYLIGVHSLTRAQLIGFSATLLILMLIIGGAALLVHYRHQAVNIISGMAAKTTGRLRISFDTRIIQRNADELFDALDALWLGGWHRPMIGAFLNTAFDMMTLYFLFLAAGERIHFGILLAGYGLPLLLGKVAFILPGGVGVVEGSMVALYSGLGVAPAMAVVVVLGYRVISFWIPTLLGFPIAAYLQGRREDDPVA